MEKSARNFIYLVLAIHALLLLLAVGIVAVAAHNVYLGARKQAIASAQQTQELLARETAAGIENYYKAVSAGLELLQPTSEEGGVMAGSGVARRSSVAGGMGGAVAGGSLAGSATSGPSSEGTAAIPTPAEILARKVPNTRFFHPTSMPALPLMDKLWQEIRQRASMLLVVDLASPLHPLIQRQYASLDLLDGRQVVDLGESWLRHLKGPALGPFTKLDGVAYTLVAAPTRGRLPRVLIAVVSISQVHSELMQWAGENSSAMLIGKNGVVMAGPDESQVGRSLLKPAVQESAGQGQAGPGSEAPAGALEAFVAKYMQGGLGGSEVIAIPGAAGSGVPTTSGADESGGGGDAAAAVPTLVTIWPVEFSQFRNRWWLVISSGLQGVDSVVNSTFRDAAVWAGCLVVSVAAILTSTAVWMIRARMRLERVRSEMIRRELEQARRIQLSWLPSKPLLSPRIDLAAINQPASHVSGDFYDWFELPDGRVTVTVGDVTGHGLTAAFLMATTQLLVRGTMQRVGDPGRCMEEVNRQLCTQVFNGQFVTLLIMTIDFEQGEMLVASAGHPAPLIGTGNTFKLLKLEPQLVLGLEADTDYASQAFPLGDKQNILLYTDGVCDAVSSDGSRFSQEMLTDVLDRQYETADSIINAVAAAVETFAAGAQLFDDLTLVAVRLQTGKMRSAKMAGAR
jgi:serine phosphatase RsbU (regulator of sigma subunit)